MLFRPHRGGLAQAMSEVKTFTSRQELVEHVREEFGRVFVTVADEAVEVKPYCYDARIGWDTYIVTVNGSVAGFTNGPI